MPMWGNFFRQTPPALFNFDSISPSLGSLILLNEFYAVLIGKIVGISNWLGNGVHFERKLRPIVSINLPKFWRSWKPFRVIIFFYWHQRHHSGPLLSLEEAEFWSIVVAHCELNHELECKLKWKDFNPTLTVSSVVSTHDWHSHHSATTNTVQGNNLEFLLKEMRQK